MAGTRYFYVRNQSNQSLYYLGYVDSAGFHGTGKLPTDWIASINVRFPSGTNHPEVAYALGTGQATQEPVLYSTYYFTGSDSGSNARQAITAGKWSTPGGTMSTNTQWGPGNPRPGGTIVTTPGGQTVPASSLKYGQTSANGSMIWLGGSTFVPTHGPQGGLNAPANNMVMTPGGKSVPASSLVLGSTSANGTMIWLGGPTYVPNTGGAGAAVTSGQSWSVRGDGHAYSNTGVDLGFYVGNNQTVKPTNNGRLWALYTLSATGGLSFQGSFGSVPGAPPPPNAGLNGTVAATQIVNSGVPMVQTPGGKSVPASSLVLGSTSANGTMIWLGGPTYVPNTTQYAQPTYQQPVYAQPAYAAPAPYAVDQNGVPIGYAQPVYQQPVYAAPPPPPVYPTTYAQPAYQQPVYAPPVYQQPMYAPQPYDPTLDPNNYAAPLAGTPGIPGYDPVTGQPLTAAQAAYQGAEIGATAAAQQAAALAAQQSAYANPYAANPYASPYGYGGGANIDPTTGYQIDPSTGYLIDPTTGGLIDPSTGMPVDPSMLGGYDAGDDPTMGGGYNPYAAYGM